MGRIWYEHGEPRARRLRGKLSEAQPVDEPFEQSVEDEPVEQVEDGDENSDSNPSS